MNFDKVISDMQLLQTKIEDYEQKEKSKDELDKHIISIKILLMKDIADRFNITKESKNVDSK